MHTTCALLCIYVTIHSSITKMSKKKVNVRFDWAIHMPNVLFVKCVILYLVQYILGLKVMLSSFKATIYN